jgi:hypothetical protein
MKSFRFADVIQEVPKSLLYYILGSVAGIAFAFLTFDVNKGALEFLLNLWSRRLLFGVELIGENWYPLWFIVNNLVVMVVVIAASVFILIQISRRPRGLSKRFRKFRNIEKRRPSITLLGLYIVPVGALIINGFLVSMFAAYVYLSYGIERLADALMLLIPHGINEIVALVLACSLGLSYLRIIKPYIMKGDQKKAIKVGKMLLKNRTTLYILVLITILVIFSGILEGILSLLI